MAEDGAHARRADAASALVNGEAADASSQPPLLPPPPPPSQSVDVSHPLKRQDAQLSNGDPDEGREPSHITRAMTLPAHGPPPELVHITEGYQPLSTLFERVAQECFNSLNETISDLSNLPGSRQVNGGSIDGDELGSNSEAGIQKRLRWLEFANSSREKFIKLLVIFLWSRQTRDDIGKLVDVVVWMREVQTLHDQIDDRLGFFGREVATMKVPNPDIETASEILSTGQSNRMPDLNYIPRPPLTPQRTLETLRNINMLLHIRLNVHEHLPSHLRHFAISSGRVTFTIPTEFEMDLSIVNEDPSTPFYLVDLRFLFSPSFEIPDGHLRAEFENRANAILASDGLSGCYDFLHDFILTSKLSVLRKQAFDLARGSWIGTLRIDRMHRSLIIQYWVDKPERKNWIEIGVKGGRRVGTDGVLHQVEQSGLSVRWMRNGKEVTDTEPIPIDTEDLNVERILEDVVARHITWILESTYSKLSAVFGSEFESPVKLFKPSVDLPSCYVSVPLFSSQTGQVRIEPTAGRFALSPVSKVSVQCENALNNLKNPAQDAFARIQAWRSIDASSIFQDGATRFHWDVVHTIKLDAATRKTIFGDASTNPCFIKRWTSPDWVVAAVPNPRTGFSAWILQIDHARPLDQDSSAVRIRDSSKVHADIAELNSQFFSSLAQFAVATISFSTIQTRLAELKIPYTRLSRTLPSNPPSFPPIPLDVSAMLHGFAFPPHVTLNHYGLESLAERPATESPDTVIHFMVAQISNDPTAHEPKMASLLTSLNSPGISVQPNGTFAVIDRSPLGSLRVVDTLIRKLRQIARLYGCLKTLHELRFKVTALSLDSLQFSYADTPQNLQARIDWREDGTVSLGFEPPENLHNRLLATFEGCLQSTVSMPSTSRPNMKFIEFTRNLVLTRPLLQAFENVEARGGVILYVESVSKYRITYAKPKCVFQVTYRQTQGQGWWYFGQAQQSPRTNDKLQGALKSLFSESSDDVMGLRTGVAASLATVGTVLDKLDQCVRGCADSDPPEGKGTGGRNGPVATGSKSKDAGNQKQNAQSQASKPTAGSKDNSMKADSGSKSNGSTGAKDHAMGNSNAVNGTAPEVVILD